MVVFDNDNNSARDTDSHFGSSHFGSRGFPPPSLHVPGRTLSGGGPRFRGLPTADTCAWPSLRGPLSAVPSRRPRRALRQPRRRRQPLEPRRRLLPTAGRGCHRARRQRGLPAAPHWGCWAASPRSPWSGGRRGTKSLALAIASFTPTLRDLKRRARKKNHQNSTFYIYQYI